MGHHEILPTMGSWVGFQKLAGKKGGGFTLQDSKENQNLQKGVALHPVELQLGSRILQLEWLEHLQPCEVSLFSIENTAFCTFLWWKPWHFDSQNETKENWMNLSWLEKCLESVECSGCGPREGNQEKFPKLCRSTNNNDILLKRRFKISWSRFWLGIFCLWKHAARHTNMHRSFHTLWAPCLFPQKTHFNTTLYNALIWVFPKIGVPQNGWFIMENPMNKWMIWGVPSPYFWKPP